MGICCGRLGFIGGRSGEWWGRGKKKQIPKGNDSKKGNGNSKGKRRSRFPEGMTERKATATAKAKEEADSLGDDSRRSKGNGKGQYRGLSTAHHDGAMMLRSR